MRYVQAFMIVLFLAVFSTIWADDSQPESSQTSTYDVYVSSGGDAYVIFGDGAVFEVTQPVPACAPNKAAAVAGGGFLVEMGPTEVVGNGMPVSFDKVVLYIGADGFTTVIFAE